MPRKSHRDIFAKDITWGRGGSDGIQYARFLMDEDDKSSPLIILSKFEAGEVVEPHTHGTNYFEYVIEGRHSLGQGGHGIWADHYRAGRLHSADRLSGSNWLHDPAKRPRKRGRLTAYIFTMTLAR